MNKKSKALEIGQEVVSKVPICFFMLFLGLFIYFSEYGLLLKLVLAVISILFITLVKCKTKFNISNRNIATLILVVMSFAHLVSLKKSGYSDYMYTYSHGYNKHTGWATTQLSYMWNTGNSDVILSTIFRDKKVCATQKDIYLEYISYFADEVEIIECGTQWDYELWKNEYITLGRMSTQAVDFLFTPEVKATIDDNKAEHNMQPVLYVSSSEVASAETIVFFSDGTYNMYIMTWDEYTELLNI